MQTLETYQIQIQDTTPKTKGNEAHVQIDNQPARVSQSGVRLSQDPKIPDLIPLPATYFCFFYCLSRRAVVSNWRKCVYEVLGNHLGGLSLSRKSVDRLTDRPDMTLGVYCGRGRKTTIQQIDERLRKTRTVNRMNRSYQTGGHSATLFNAFAFCEIQLCDNPPGKAMSYLSTYIVLLHTISATLKLLLHVPIRCCGWD